MANTTDQNDTGMAPAYIAAGIILLLLGIYWLFHDYIVYSIFLIRRFELAIISLWDPRYNMLLNWCNHVIEKVVTLKQLKYLSYNITSALLWYYWGVGSILVCFLWFLHPNQKFRRTFNMDLLASTLKKHFKKVYLPQNNPIQKDQYTQSLSPIRFLKKHRLISNVTNLGEQTEKLNTHALHDILVKQLGPKWSNKENISEETYGLFAAFIAFIADKRQLGEKILATLNQKYGKQNNALSGFSINRVLSKLIDESISSCIENAKVSKAINQHYYAYTLLCELLYVARTGGIISSTSFLWLKGINRSLWYGLNNLGRQTFFTEGAMINTHWHIEHMLQQKMKNPMTESVIDALQKEYNVQKSLHDSSK
ncbi:secretion/conjugation apparatus DotM-related subunit [Facilibium subflavum]|uniref:secretion/conjugation apparatus DotM-related subunit n=1 Tax=Facilibium subflavum TaxID=2219058 RepID=UPI000E658156|nr:hypothetical protein [Facilibium subflavum]